LAVHFSPPLAPKQAAAPLLMQALLTKDATQVRRALQCDPEAAALPFLDHTGEPLLCCAVRVGCGKEILGVLLKAGADANIANARGRGPLAMLCSRARLIGPLPPLQEWAPFGPGFAFADVFEPCPVIDKEGEGDLIGRAALLMAAGANPHLPDAEYATAESLALASGNKSLVALLRYYDAFQACTAILRSASIACTPDATVSASLGGLPVGPMHAIFAFLLPHGVERTLNGILGALARTA